MKATTAWLVLVMFGWGCGTAVAAPLRSDGFPVNSTNNYVTAVTCSNFVYSLS